MPSTSIIRLAAGRDAAPVRDIYAPFVRDTPVSFEVEPPTAEEMGRRIADTLERFPWLVCENAGEVAGYVYAAPHRARAAYRWSVDVAVYVQRGARRSGVGRALYASLFEILRRQGFSNAFAGITLPNPSSVGLHEAVGFEPVGVYRAVGHKAGAWHDVGWWQLALREQVAAPADPLPLDAVRARADWQTALDAGLPLLRL